jgi:hypothetical protein
MAENAPLLTTTNAALAAPPPASSGDAVAGAASAAAPAYGGQSPAPPPGYPGAPTSSADAKYYPAYPPQSPGGAPGGPYYQPMPGATAPMAPQVMVTTSQAGVVPFRDVPVIATCTNCNATGLTRVELHAGLLTWLMCGGISIVVRCSRPPHARGIDSDVPPRLTGGARGKLTCACGATGVYLRLLPHSVHARRRQGPSHAPAGCLSLRRLSWLNCLGGHRTLRTTAVRVARPWASTAACERAPQPIDPARAHLRLRVCVRACVCVCVSLSLCLILEPNGTLQLGSWALQARAGTACGRQGQRHLQSDEALGHDIARLQGCQRPQL